MVRLFLFVLGIVLTSIGTFFCILYLNLLTFGYSFGKYLHFIIRRSECLLFFLGIFLILLSLGRRIKDELLLRYRRKLGRK